MAEDRLAKLFYVSGMVQGVGYRFFAQRTAARIGVAGFAKNLRDGRVEVYAIGTPAQLAEMKTELRRGPRMASVSGVEEEDAGFESRYAGAFSIEHESW